MTNCPSSVWPNRYSRSAWRRLGPHHGKRTVSNTRRLSRLILAGETNEPQVVSYVANLAFLDVQHPPVTAREELFPKAYALVLGGLVEEIARVDGWDARRPSCVPWANVPLQGRPLRPIGRVGSSSPPPPRCAAWEEMSRCSARSEGIRYRGTPVRSRR